MMTRTGFRASPKPTRTERSQWCDPGATSAEPSEKAKAVARELAELADETLTGEGDPVKYEAEMETLRGLFAPLLDAFAAEAARENLAGCVHHCRCIKCKAWHLISEWKEAGGCPTCCQLLVKVTLCGPHRVVALVEAPRER